jgi:hypothetical protein
MRYPDASSFPGMILWAAGVTGPLVPPGTYKVRLAVNGKPVGTETFKVLPDPRIKATLADWQEQSRVALAVRDRFSEANDAVKEIRRIKSELADREKKLPSAQLSQFTTLSVPFATSLSEVEDSLYQTKKRSAGSTQLPDPPHNCIARCSVWFRARTAADTTGVTSTRY